MSDAAFIHRPAPLAERDIILRIPANDIRLELVTHDEQRTLVQTTGSDGEAGLRIGVSDAETAFHGSCTSDHVARGAALLAVTLGSRSKSPPVKRMCRGVLEHYTAIEAAHQDERVDLYDSYKLRTTSSLQ